MKRAVGLVFLLAIGCDLSTESPSSVRNAEAEVSSTPQADEPARDYALEVDTAKTAATSARAEAFDEARREAWHRDLSARVAAAEKKRDAARIGSSGDEKIKASAEWNKLRIALEKRESEAVGNSPSVIEAERHLADATAALREFKAAERDREVAESRRKNRDDLTTYSADQVVAFYAANEVAGDEALKGREFKVKGEVDRVGKDILNQSYVALKADRADSFRRVQCFFHSSKNDQLATLRPGQRVVIAGTCKGLSINVLMGDCELK